MYIPITNAKTMMYVTGNVVRFRKGPGVNQEQITTLNKGYSVEVTNNNPVNKDSSCSNGWYEVVYNNQKGYVCSNYLSKTNPTETPVTTNNELLLPWTSPKKAIMGGASFIARDYISAGQYSIYLKKYNVNPTSSSGVNRHQYQANIMAPASEATSAYKSYKENNLLTLPLHFTIPIFIDMPAKTTHPKYGEQKIDKTEITDQEFEKKLNQEGFDETYKVWLRALHKKYPNWTFSSLKTELNFTETVNTQTTIGSIQKSVCSECVEKYKNEDGTTYDVETERGWFIATHGTVAYYLDPRNFLTENHILMFEDLSYNEVYTEQVVQSVLKNTFMSGKDDVDNVTYSSMFMEAGKTYNVNPVYLAALSRQEVGTKIGTVTSGERFEYEGITYEGFYNFYNIGAYSSASNPAKAGLVYAAKGAKKNEEGIYVGNIKTSNTPLEIPSENNSETSKPVETTTPVSAHLANMNLNQKGNYLTNLTLNSTVNTLKSKTNAKELTFKKSNGGVMGDSEKITTGTMVTFKSGETLTVVIYGDITGDGEIDSADLLRMRQILLGKVTLNGAYLEAAHVYNTTGKIDSSDLLRLRQHLLGKTNINQV